MWLGLAAAAHAAPRAPEDQFLDPMPPRNSLTGTSVAIDGDRALVGAPGSFGAQVGLVYVFERTDGRWALVDTLESPDGDLGSFGTSVALHGDVAVVGSPAFGGVSRPGRAHVFTRTDTTWSRAELVRPDGAPARFGTSVAVGERWIVVGAPDTDSMESSRGAAFVYGTDGSGGEALPIPEMEMDEDDLIGASVAVAGDSVLVGAPGDDVRGPGVGAVHTFEFDGGWTAGDVLRPNLAEPADFGRAVAIADAGRLAIVGAPTEVEGGLAFVYARASASEAWGAPQEIRPEDATPSNDFGASVAIAADVALVGDPLNDAVGNDAGSAFFFERRAGTWTEVAQFVIGEAADGDQLGTSVGLGGRMAIAGGPGRSSRAGLVASFPFPEPDGVACSADGRCQSGFCVDGVCCESACGGGAAMDCVVCSAAAGSSADGRCEARPDSMACEGTCGGAGTCGAGMCSTDCPDSGTGSDGGLAPVVQISGCACGVTRADHAAGALLLGAIVIGLLRRRR